MGNYLFGTRMESSSCEHWSYFDDDECGPSHWNIDPHFHHQSPINIDSSTVKKIESKSGLIFENYDKVLKGMITNTGHTAQVSFADSLDKPQISGGDLEESYQLQQYHFHWGDDENQGSEHKIDGCSYPAELHLVHTGLKNPQKLAVIAVFLRVSPKGTAFLDEESALPQIVEACSKHSLEHISLTSKLPTNRSSFWRYDGSLTTPPCSETVTWTIFTQPIDVTSAQLQLLRNLKDHKQRCLKKTFRPIQALNDRIVSEYIVKEE